MYKLFLDDVRNPMDCVTYMHQRIGPRNTLYLDNDWVIVRNYHDFCETIKKEGLPSVVSFDHDLAEIHYDPRTWTEGFEYTEETGDDCAKWLVAYCDENDVNLPSCFVHSMNPGGTENIKRTLNKTR